MAKKQTALGKEKEKVATLEGTVKRLKTTISVQCDTLGRKETELADKQQELIRKIEELVRKNEEIQKLEAGLNESLDRDTAEFFMDRIVNIVKKLTDDC